MKRISILITSFLLTSLAMLTSCENGDVEFGDFDYQTVYFAQQKPVRTITLGDDVYPTDLDNEHRFQVLCTLGGIEKNKKDRHVQVTIDKSLCEGVTFADGTAVKALPDNYYQIDNLNVTIPSGDIWGRLNVKLTDAFFADPMSAKLTYVLPVRIVKSMENDSILANQEYVLYAVKYKNKYTGCWLSHGTDNINLNGTTTSVVRGDKYRENDELRYLTTVSLNQCQYNVSTNVNVKKLNEEGKVVEDILTLTCPLQLQFDGNESCTVTSLLGSYAASGSGNWVHEGAKKAWGDKDRDQISLNYKIRFTYQDYDASKGAYVERYKEMNCEDILVMRDRQSKFETF